jgi:hypothetical protein
VNRNHFANLCGSGGSGIGCGLHRTHIPANKYRDQAGANLDLPDQNHICGLYHCIGCFNARNQAARLNQSQRFLCFFCHLTFSSVTVRFVAERRQTAKSSPSAFFPRLNSRFAAGILFTLCTQLSIGEYSPRAR